MGKTAGSDWDSRRLGDHGESRPSVSARYQCVRLSNLRRHLSSFRLKRITGYVEAIHVDE
jgi:hypothetical protein